MMFDTGLTLNSRSRLQQFTAGVGVDETADQKPKSATSEMHRLVCRLLGGPSPVTCWSTSIASMRSSSTADTFVDDEALADRGSPDEFVNIVSIACRADEDEANE